MDRPHANPNPLGAINPLRFGNSSGKSGCPLWLGKIGESAETFGGPEQRKELNSVREDAHPLTQEFETDCVATASGTSPLYRLLTDESLS